MTVKLAVLKSGEEVITDVKEMHHGEGENTKVVGYFFRKPCVVRMKDLDIPDNKPQVTFDISLQPWVPLGKGPIYPVAMDWIVTFVDPIDKLANTYQEQILDQEDEKYGEISDQDFGFNGPDAVD